MIRNNNNHAPRDPDPSASSHEGRSISGGNSATEKESETLEEESEHDYTSSSFQEFHTEIRRMSKDADQLLDSFRQEVLGQQQQQHRKQNTMKRKAPENTTTTTTTVALEDDDSLSDEERRLEEVTAAIRVSLDSKTTDSMDEEISPMHNPGLITNSPQLEDQVPTTNREHFTFASPASVSQPNENKKHNRTRTTAKYSDSELLLLTVTIIWALVAAFLVHAKFYLMDENGRIRFPFENWFR
jgi:hypothetical protein